MSRIPVAPNGFAMTESPASTAEITVDRLKRLQFRAWHRGTREADYMIGCYFDRFHANWNTEQVVWFEELIEEDDVDIMTWALGTQIVPEKYQGAMMDVMRKLDYVEIPR